MDRLQNLPRGAELYSIARKIFDEKGIDCSIADYEDAWRNLGYLPPSRPTYYVHKRRYKNDIKTPVSFDAKARLLGEVVEEEEQHTTTQPRSVTEPEVLDAARPAPTSGNKGIKPPCDYQASRRIFEKLDGDCTMETWIRELRAAGFSSPANPGAMYRRHRVMYAAEVEGQPSPASSPLTPSSQETTSSAPVPPQSSPTESTKPTGKKVAPMSRTVLSEQKLSLLVRFALIVNEMGGKEAALEVLGEIDKLYEILGFMRSAK